MANNIGTAVVRIIADSAGFERAVKNIDKSLRGQADDIGQRFGSRMGETASRWLRRGLVVGAVAVAAAVGGALKKGFERFTTIEDATASLTLQLGSATKAAKLLDKTLKVVEGTPFALDQFVDAARNLVAASIPLEKVPGILTAVADAAAAAGGSAEDVDQVVAAITRLATGAELTLGPIRDLEQLGVPALRILANRAGKTTRDMAKDISAGTVASKKSIDDLVAGLIEGTEGINGATVAFGGAAKNVGNTVSGAWSNMRIAIARAGAKVIAVFAESGEAGNGLVGVLNSMRETIDILGDRAVVFAKKFVGSDGFGRVLSFFENLPERVEKVGVVEAILEGLRKGFGKAPADKVGEVMSLIIVKGIEGISEHLPTIVAAVIKVAPKVIVGIGKGLIQAAQDNPLDMALFLVALGIPGVAGALSGFFGALPFGSIVAPLIRGIGGAISAGFSAIGLTGAFSALGAKLALEFSLLGTRIGLAVLGLSAGVAAALTGALVVIAGVGLGIVLNQLVEKFFPGINRAIEDFGGDAYEMFAEIFSQIGESLFEFGGNTYEFFAELPGRIRGALEEFGGDVYEWFAELPGRILAAIGDIWERFKEVGRNIIDGIKEGASGVINDSSWGKYWQDVGGDIYDWVTGSGGVDARSPSRKFMTVGKNIVEGIMVGVQNTAPRLDSMMQNLVPTNSFDLSGGTGHSRATIHNWTINEATPHTTAEQVIARLAVS